MSAELVPLAPSVAPSRLLTRRLAPGKAERS
jgi:hypothetical protein